MLFWVCLCWPQLWVLSSSSTKQLSRWTTSPSKHLLIISSSLTQTMSIGTFAWHFISFVNEYRVSQKCCHYCFYIETWNLEYFLLDSLKLRWLLTILHDIIIGTPCMYYHLQPTINYTLLLFFSQTFYSLELSIFKNNRFLYNLSCCVFRERNESPEFNDQDLLYESFETFLDMDDNDLEKY